jgi:hypothetical protein
MFRDKVKLLIEEYGVKRQSIIDLIGSNRVTFPKKIENNSFDSIERKKIMEKYGSLL